MRRLWFRIPALTALLATLVTSATFADEPVRITLKPRGLVHGDLKVPVSADEAVKRIELRINGVRFDEQEGRSVVFTVPVGEFIRRLRVRAVGYGVADQIVGEDEMVVNDPQPPFRIRLKAPRRLPLEGPASMSVAVTLPDREIVESVEFFLEEESIGSDGSAPFEITFDPSLFPDPRYARATVQTRSGAEAYDVHFFGTTPADSFEVVLQQIPLSASGNSAPIEPADFDLIDNGDEREIESLVPAADKPLSVLMLIDSSQSMLKELPIVQAAAKEFARAIIGPRDRIAVVAFHQRTFWLTGFTNDIRKVDAAVDRIDPRGQTHLYDAVIEMLYELQKQPGRHALVVLSDGVNQGGSFELDHVVHYARYSGVPLYPIIRNTWLSRFMRFGISFFEAKRFANIAEESGATYFIVRDPKELPEVYRTIAEELRRQYLILFHTEASNDDRWHTLGIRSKKRDIKLRVPRGYFQ